MYYHYNLQLAFILRYLAIKVKLNNCMTPYLTIPFSFSEKSLNWTRTKVAPIADDYQKNAPLPAGLVEFPREDMQDWYDSDAYKEILAHLQILGIDEEPVIQFFVYKKLEKMLSFPWLGNPHIDTYNGVKDLATFRLNLLLDGDDDAEMVWWDIHDMKNDPRLHTIEFPRPNDPTKFSVRCQVVGNTKEERWETAGEPVWSKTHLAKYNTYASFVRTDYLHAINWNGKNPRFILSLRFSTPWEHLENLRNQVPGLFPQLLALKDQFS
jgi:hypothetical protein